MAAVNVTPRRSSPRKLLVFEQRPYWTPALQRLLPSDAWHVRRCEPVDQLDAAFPAAGVLLDLAADPRGCLLWLGQRSRRNAIPVMAVATDDETAGLEAIFRELGVVSFLVGIPAPNELARVIQSVCAE
jgi:hypothetical protein